ncbi:MAG: cation:proton antiporter [Acidimicrobiia bacterium]
MTTEEVLLSVTGIVVLGVAAQWSAWRLRLPSILLLLLGGLLVGPVTGLLDPDELLGDLLFPLVSLSVGLILFEGGLSLDLRELRTTGGVVRNLVSFGAMLTGALVGLSAYVIFDINEKVAALLGAVLVVTGPTVIGPLLRHVRPVRRVGSIARAEGILIDPIGALLALLVFEVVVQEELGEATGAVVTAIVRTFGLGSLIGLAGAFVLAVVLKRFLVPDELTNLVVLGAVIAVFTGADFVQEESGLLAVTVMGLALSNQRTVPTHNLLEFNETLRVLLISGLFILLAARLDTGSMADVVLPGLLFLGVLVVVIRPLVVALSTWRSELGWRERVFLAWLAPRGIVAAAVASIFAIRLAEAGAVEAETILVPVTFLVIIGTIVIYGSTAGWLARRLDLSDSDPQGVLFIGAPRWAVPIAEELLEHEYRVVMVDTDRANVARARLAGVRTYYGSALSERLLEEIDLTGIGRVIALTSNDEVNTLAAEHFARLLGRRETFQLEPADSSVDSRWGPSSHLLARRPFGSHTHAAFEKWHAEGAAIRATRLTEEFDLKALRARYEWGAVPLFLIHEEGNLDVFTEGGGLRAEPGDTVVSLVHPDARGEAERRERAREKREKKAEKVGRATEKAARNGSERSQ